MSRHVLTASWFTDGPIFHVPLTVMVYAPPSNIITSLTSLWLLIDILWKLSNIPTMAKSGCWLLTPNHKCYTVSLHWYSQHILGPLQVHWSLKLIWELPRLIFEQDGKILVLDVRCQDLIYNGKLNFISCTIEPIVPCCDNHREYVQERGFSKVIRQ